MSSVRIAIGTLALSLLLANVSNAQGGSAQSRAASPSRTALGIRGFADLGSTSFTASESFETILGSSSGMVFGGGGEAVLPMNVFIAVRASRFHRTGHRVFSPRGTVSI